MNTIHSSLSRMETTISLQAIAYCLTKCRPLLSDYERELTKEFVSMVVASMVKSLDDHITISLYLTSEDALTESHVLTGLYAVLDALKLPKPGTEEQHSWEPSKKTALNTSLATSAKNTQQPKTTTNGKNPSHECHSGPASEPE